MELGYLFSSQIILITSFLATISLAESTKTAYSLRSIAECSFIKVSGEKGSILLLFCISSSILFILDLVSSQAKICGCKTFSKNAKRAKFQHLMNLFILFISFISAYVFQSLNFRVNNLLGIALVALNLISLSNLIGLMFVKTWILVIFMMCNMLIFSFTFIKNSESFYLFLLSKVSFRI